MQSFYNGLGGMLNFSKSLDNVSNNIGNMNTPGFRGNDLFMRGLGGDMQGDGATIGVKVARDQAGDLKQTGVATDLAINGDGLFILKNDSGDIFYSRAGQFKFNEKNVLVDGATGMQVMAINSAGALSKIDISTSKTLSPEATTAIDLLGNLSSTDTSYSLTNVTVYNSVGDKFQLKLDFAKAAAPATNTWNVTVKSASDAVLGTFTTQFGADATPLTGFNSINQTLVLGTSSQTIAFNFGASGSLSGATQLSGTSNLGAMSKDGHAILGLSSLSVDTDGVIQFKYTNGTTKSGQQVGIALFNDPSTLAATHNGMLKANNNTGLKYGKPSNALFGSIQSKSIEMSNVDLTQEFADILIIQRGYQASSRIMSVSNDLLDQLYNSTRSK
ncbi:flagellar hook protein FlgE [Cellvibrio zantedeschiae]|uniref:Flagellar hook protein FlgE n=1 Tax=Cellvibrio zantedeschiae TaxID=1237077 RepID=A0ABQ3BBT1_9GAMM|nr:flagellar hook-basal body complex protein [Cellvibrio zantedeschiae]GGY84888.1 flagellar hook protein FlgE [Cellvibrio zantedeschiae]